MWLLIYLHFPVVFFIASVQRYDPTYESTKMHFEDLVNRYGNPIIVLNLIKVSFLLNALFKLEMVMPFVLTHKFLWSYSVS